MMAGQSKLSFVPQLAPQSIRSDFYTPSCYQYTARMAQIPYKIEYNHWPTRQLSDLEVLQTVEVEYWCLPKNTSSRCSNNPSIWRKENEESVELVVCPQIYREAFRAAIHASNCWRVVLLNIDWQGKCDHLLAQKPPRTNELDQLGKVWSGAVESLYNVHAVIREACETLRTLGCDPHAPNFDQDIPVNITTFETCRLQGLEQFHYEQLQYESNNLERLEKPDTFISPLDLQNEFGKYSAYSHRGRLLITYRAALFEAYDRASVRVQAVESADTGRQRGEPDETAEQGKLANAKAAPKRGKSTKGRNPRKPSNRGGRNKPAVDESSKKGKATGQTVNAEQAKAPTYETSYLKALFGPGYEGSNPADGSDEYPGATATFLDQLSKALQLHTKRGKEVMRKLIVRRRMHGLMCISLIYRYPECRRRVPPQPRGKR